MTTLQISQPYKTWKSSSKLFSAVPRWSRPIDRNSEELTGPFGKARPLKHWRKQLVPNQVNGSSKSISIPFNYPGSYNYLGIDNCDCADTSEGNRITMNLDTDINNRVYSRDGFKVKGPNGSTVCVACNPERNIIKSGRTEKLINPVNSESEPQRKYSHDTKSYLRSKVATYNQRLTGARVPGIDYVVPGSVIPVQPSDSYQGSQVRNSLECAVICDNNPIKIIYKPNNSQFSQQGAVSSSSRIERLKLLTVNKAANSLRQPYGDAAANSSKYSATSNAPYTIKSIDNRCRPSLYHRNGNRTMCR
jgi:hypothetical protein